MTYNVNDRVNLTKNAFRPGTILWREVVPAQSRRDWQIADTRFERIDTSYGAKVVLTGQSFREPVVLSMTTSQGKFVSGIMLFVDELPDQNWTHLILKGVNTTGTTLFATLPEKYLDVEKYLDFRYKMYTLMATLRREGRLSDFSYVLEKIRDIAITDIGGFIEGNAIKRLVMDHDPITTQKFDHIVAN